MDISSSSLTRPPRIRLINAEPILLFFNLGIGLFSTVYQPLILFKICMHIVGENADQQACSPFDDAHDFCADLVGSATDSKTNSSDRIRDEMERASSKFMVYYQICENAPVIVVGLLVGALSDAYGKRKPPIAVALVGMVMSIFILLTTASIDQASLYLALLAALVKSCTGSMLVIYSLCFAMISDACQGHPAKSTVRLGVAAGVVCFGHVMGTLLSAFILSRWDNYSYILLLSIGFITISFFYTVFGASETLPSSSVLGSKRTADDLVIPDDDNDEPTEPHDHFADDDDNRAIGGVQSSDDVRARRPSDNALRSCLRGIYFAFDRLRESKRTVFNKRPERRRTYLLVSLASLTVAFACDYGLPGILNLFVKLPPLSLTDSEYSYLIASITFAMTLGTTLIPWIGKRLFRARDSLMIILGLSIAVGKMIATAFSSEHWMIFTASALGSLSAVYFTGFRAFMSKLVRPDENGRLFAVVISCEHIGTLLSAAVFSNVFASTLAWFPGFVFIISGAVMTIVLLTMSWVHFDSVRRHLELDTVSDATPKSGDDCDRSQLLE